MMRLWIEIHDEIFDFEKFKNFMKFKNFSIQLFEFWTFIIKWLQTFKNMIGVYEVSTGDT